MTSFFFSFHQLNLIYGVVWGLNRMRVKLNSVEIKSRKMKKVSVFEYWPLGSSLTSSGRVSTKMSSVSLVSFSVLLLVNVMLVAGQSSSEVSSSCVCDGGVSCERNLTASDCPNGRVIPRGDCKCCFVCAKQLTEACNSKESPCDSDFGLICGEKKQCQAATTCSDDTSCSSDRFCVAGACADPCRVLADVCDSKSPKNAVCIVRNHRAICSCRPGQTMDTNKNECVDTPQDKEEEAHCEQEGHKVEIGKNFYTDKCSKICECEKNGKMSCQPVDSDVKCQKGFIPMSMITGDMSDLCKILIGNDNLFDGCCVPQKCLNATTQDEIKGSRGFKLTESQNNLEDEDDKPKPREMLLSEEDQRIAAADSGEAVATTMMPGSAMMGNSEEQVEEKEEEEKEKEKKEEEGEKASSNTTGSGVVTDSMNKMQVTVLKRTAHSALVQLPKNDKEAMLSIALSAQVMKDPENTDVWKLHKIPPGLPQITLSDLLPNTSYTLKYSIGDKGFPLVQFITDGASSSSPSSTPLPVKPVTPPVKTDGCIFNNKTYPFGAEHFDGCSYKCHCETSGEFLCRPRCNYRRDEEKEIPKDCEVKKDPRDDCCEVLACEGDEHLEASSKESSDSEVLTDGCNYKNQTYAREKKFYDGCEQQCTCLGNGDVSCQPRCPPAGPHVDDDCITLPDPADKCCTVTVCDPQEKLAISDVMKAANESELASANHSSTEVPILIPKGRSDDISTTILPSPATSPASSTTTTSSTTAASTTAATSTTKSTTESPKILPVSSEIEEEDDKVKPSLSSQENLSQAKITMIIPLNETSVMVTIGLSEKDLAQLDDQMVKIYYSNDMKTWLELVARIKDLYVEGSNEIHTVINGLSPAKEYFFKAKINGTETNTVSGYTRTKMSSSEEFEISSHEMSSGESEGSHSGSMEETPIVMCKYKDGHFHPGQEFYDGCDAYCSCEEEGLLKCVPIECPTDLGLELLDANCLRWEPVGAETFVREPPHCCPEMRCVQNSTCEIEGGYTFKNYDEIPQKLSGCDKRCFCDNGNITCEQLCPPMPEKPPAQLPCPPEMAMAVTIPQNECCYTWVCRNHRHNVTDDPSSLLEHLHMLNHTLTQQTLHDLKNMTLIPTNGTTFIPYHSDEVDQDQVIPPSTGNKPSYVPLNQINRDQLEDLLHHLSTITEGASGHVGQPTQGEIRPGTYLSVKDPEEVQELERQGAKVIEQAEDGSFIVFIPTSPHGHNPNIPIYPPPEVLGHGGAVPPGFPYGHPFALGDPHAHAHGPGQTDQLGNVMIRPLNESTLMIDFTVSPVLVGLHGVVEVLYTRDFATKQNPDQWERQVFQQAEDLIDNSHLQLFLTGLEPDTEYHLKIQVIMRDIQNAPESRTLMIRTPPATVPTTTLPPEIVIDADINLVDVSSNTVKISWRKFSDLESSLIDGVQIKYRAEQDQLFSTTSLIHRSINNYELTNLQPGQSYEVDLLFIPFTNQTTELRSEKPIHIKTLPEEDLYSFTIALETGKVTESTAELILSGVPYPEDKFVNIYHVIYQSDEQKEQKSTFKVAKRENSKPAVITDLKPGTRYRVWVEAFLTNGKKKLSNVINVLTKAGQLPTPDKASQDKQSDETRSQESVAESGSYYGALVALAIIAALAIVGIVVLLMILIRKQSQSKAPISDRKSESSYDNPSFKNYDLESNGHSKPGD